MARRRTALPACLLACPACWFAGPTALPRLIDHVLKQAVNSDGQGPKIWLMRTGPTGHSDEQPSFWVSQIELFADSFRLAL